jgi:hypothetical protein
VFWQAKNASADVWSMSDMERLFDQFNIVFSSFRKIKAKNLDVGNNLIYQLEKQLST